jgi:putative hydrolase of the HAD superfamily
LAPPLLVFDLDDTLYPERDYVRSGFRAVADALEDRFGYPAAATCRELDSLFADGSTKVFDRWLKDHGVKTAGALEFMISRYRMHRPHIRPFADGVWALAAFGHSHLLALLSDGRGATQRAKIDSLGIAGYFGRIVITGEYEASYAKPGVAGFVLLLHDLGLSAEDAVYVADNPAKDFLGPRSLGMATIRVRRPCGLYSALEPAGAEYAPDVQIDSLFSLPRFVGLAH